MEVVNMSEEKIYIGIDIGTDSVGYAVTDQNYVLKRFHGEPIWGVTLFEEANLNTERRLFRTSRRRLDRRQQRVALIQELFSQEIEKIDPQFYIRLKESSLYRDEAEASYSVFEDNEYTDKEYYEQYPTIHHLISTLISSNLKHDIRLVYMACAWLVAHRGHFLSEINKENIDGITDFSLVYKEFTAFFINNGHTIPWNEADASVIKEILQKKLSVSSKYTMICMALFNEKRAPKTPFEYFPYNCEAILKAICGSNVKVSDIFVNKDYSEISSFSLGDDDNKLSEIFASVNDEETEMLKQLKAIYDWSLLVDALNGKQTISEAKVEIYNQHKKDLAQLKMLVRKYVPEKYNEIFRHDRSDNYTAYIKSTSYNDNFYAYIKKIINDISVSKEDIELYEEIQKKIELKNFLPKQRHTNNRIIPYQLYWYELKKILENAENHYDFLTEIDENGLTVSDKILSVFSFRVPYFVGPLNESSTHSWIKRKSGKIYPWNFDNMVDLDASEQEFIKKMTNKCTYLPEEDVLPKESLIYHKFTVLNEINNIKIDGIPVSVELKQKIYTDLFCCYKKVTIKKLKDFLKSENYLSDNNILSGVDIQINADLKSYHDFKHLLHEGILSENDVEKIIERLTYSEDKNRFAKWLKNTYTILSENDIRYISKLNYTGFGRLSAKFLTDFSGMNKESHEVYTIIDALWNTNNNLMMLLSENYTFAEKIQDIQSEYYGSTPRSIDERLSDMYVSNAVKRPIIRALEIVREIEKALGKTPAKIFIEMPRGASAEQKNKRTITRKQQLIDLYSKCRDEDVRCLEQQLEDMGDLADNNLQSDRLFLYFMQLGKCMYSGEAIDITQIKGNTYNIEHIYPQSIVKDDSIINNEILVKSEINGEKSDTYPVSGEIQSKMRPFWEMLRKNGLISDEKFNRLVRKTPFSDDEKFGFINRQLTETSQSAKAIAILLKERYPDTEIVYVKARLVSEFRQTFGLLKSRTFNDLHHAKDAYLNIVTGNLYHEKFTRNYILNNKYNIKTEQIFTKDFIRGKETIWKTDQMLPYVKKVLTKNNAHMTRYAFCRHGGFFDQMPLPAAEGLIPRKKDLPAEKYGGYNSAKISFFMLVKYKAGKKSDVMFMPVELLDADKIVKDYDFAAAYAIDRINRITGKSVDEVSFPLGLRKIKINTMLSLDGFRVCIAGSAGNGRIIILPYTPFSANNDVNLYLKYLESFNEKCKKNPNLIYKEEYDKISMKKNAELYDLYIEKLEKTIYKKRPNNASDILRNGRDIFTSLDIKNQVVMLLSIHQLFGKSSGPFDLKGIGGSSKSAYCRISANISNFKKSYSDVRIIDTSASGLWEKVSDNLLELL